MRASRIVASSLVLLALASCDTGGLIVAESTGAGGAAQDAGAGGRGGAPGDADPDAAQDGRDLPDALEFVEAATIE